MKQMIRWILAALSFMLATGLAACADDTPCQKRKLLCNQEMKEIIQMKKAL